MTQRSDGMATAVPNRLPRWARGVAYAACGWAFAFAALSCYWALGGTAGAQTISPAIVALARAHDPLVYAALWLGALVKVISGVVVLALIQPWGERVPRPALLTLTWGAGTLLFVHGGLYFVVGVLALSGTIRVGTPLLMLRWFPVGAVVAAGRHAVPPGGLDWSAQIAEWARGPHFQRPWGVRSTRPAPPERRNHRLSGQEREGFDAIRHSAISVRLCLSK
jgi:hypothetical protein